MLRPKRDFHITGKLLGYRDRARCATLVSAIPSVSAESVEECLNVFGLAAIYRRAFHRAYAGESLGGFRRVWVLIFAWWRRGVEARHGFSSGGSWSEDFCAFMRLAAILWQASRRMNAFPLVAPAVLPPVLYKQRSSEPQDPRCATLHKEPVARPLAFYQLTKPP